VAEDAGLCCLDSGNETNLVLFERVDGRGEGMPDSCRPGHVAEQRGPAQAGPRGNDGERAGSEATDRKDKPHIDAARNLLSESQGSKSVG
jgi:hypothetical protein